MKKFSIRFYLLITVTQLQAKFEQKSLEKRQESSENLSDHLLCIATRQSKSEVAYYKAVSAARTGLSFLWRNLCMCAHVCVGGPNQNKKKFQNIVHIQWNYFSQDASGMQSQMPSFKLSCVNRLGPWQEKRNLFWNTGDGKCQKLVVATLSTSYIPISLKLIATVEMQHASVLPRDTNTGAIHKNFALILHFKNLTSF